MEPRPPFSLAELLREIRQTGDYRRLTEAIPYARFLGLHVEPLAGEVVCRMEYTPKLIGHLALHGGTLGALLESAAIFELLRQSATEHVPKVISLTVDFLRSGRLQDTYAKALITRQGRRVANVRVEAWQEDRARPIATAHVLLLLSPPPGASRE
jgi:acyl-coenzyme A thioesterase PaaI-like protein